MDADVPAVWLASGKPALIGGLYLRLRPSPQLAGAVVCSRCGQAEVFFANASDGSGWVIKKFLPGKSPDDSHLKAVAKLLPQHAGFRCGTTRRILHGRDLKKQSVAYYSVELRDWIDGTVLMPEITGNDWSTVGEDIRSGISTPTPEQRRALCASLSEHVVQLESVGCAHRDISHGNVYADPTTGQTEFIDFDAVYHSSLSMPKNTTCGTDGYIAPFLSHHGRWNAAETWCPIADRFSLAVLNAEFLVTRKGSPQGNDGGLFPQDELCLRKGKHFDHAADALRVEYPEAWPLFHAAINSDSFDDCPPPSAWLNLYAGRPRVLQQLPTRRVPSLAELPAVRIHALPICPPATVALPPDPWLRKAI